LFAKISASMKNTFKYWKCQNWKPWS